MKNKMNVYLMFVIVFLQGFVFYGPIATVYRQARGLSMTEIFLLESIFFVLMIVFEVPWGWFADRFGYKTTLIAANLLFFLSKVVFYEAHTFSSFLIESLLIALALSGLSGCDIALIYSSISGEESQKVFGRYNAVATAGFLCASLISTLIISRSMDFAAFLTIIPYGAAAFLSFFLKEVKVKPEKKPSIRESFSNMFKNRRILVFVLSIALVSEVSHAVSVFLSQPQYLRSGISIQYFGILMALIQIVGIVSVKSYKIVERFDRDKCIGLIVLGISFSCFLLALFRNPGVSIALIALTNAGFALLRPIALDIQNKSITTQDRATILSMYAMGGDIMSAVVNLFIGKSADISAGMAFTVCGGISLLAFVIFILYCAIQAPYKKMDKELA